MIYQQGHKPREIENIADQLNQKAGFSIPVDIKEIAFRNDIGLTIEECELETGVSGRIEIENNKAHIFLNQSHHPNRKRFTAAHELGHFILHKEMSRTFVDGSPYGSVLFFRAQLASQGEDYVEIEANNFAASLLMPKIKVVEEFNKLSIMFNEDEDLALKYMASNFRVSVQALMIRLAKLQLIPKELIEL